MTELAPLFDALRDVLHALGEDFEFEAPMSEDAEDDELEYA